MHLRKSIGRRRCGLDVGISKVSRREVRVSLVWTKTPASESVTPFIPLFVAGFAATGFAVTSLAGLEPDSNAASGQASSERWNWHLQNTSIAQGYPALNSPYSGANSLPSGGQIRESISFDVTAGVRLWSGASAFIDGMMWQGYGINNTRGIAGFPNGEAFRLGTAEPNGSITRLFVRQDFGWGGELETIEDRPMALAGSREVSRVTITAGRLSAKDMFDQNAYANDPRTQFLNWGLMANEAWDYPADALGYTTGLAVEFNQPSWTLRYGLFQLPKVSNGLTAEDRWLKWPIDHSAADGPVLDAWGMVMEWERRFRIGERPGAIRLLTYLNRAHMGNYQLAVDSLVRPAVLDGTRTFRYKFGFCVNGEQEVAPGLGVFTRMGWSDGRNEAWVFSDVDWTVTAGLSWKGKSWGRADDTVGLAGIVNGISVSHQRFLQNGGLGILAGDGDLTYSPEKIIETYYDCALGKSIHAALDYQLALDPAFNRDRGPAHVMGVRLHWEY